VNNWEKVWNKEDRTNKIILDCLVKADGFSSSSRKYEEDSWTEYCESFFLKLNILQNESIFEVGCGSGAFLYLLYLKKNIVAGIDYSSSLINLARKLMPEGNFICEDVINFQSNNSYDVVLSHSVFQYFKDLNEAELVIKSMAQMAKKKIAVFDVTDITKYDLFHSVRMNNYINEGFSEDDYKKRYQGLTHLFFSKDWFEEIGEKLNLKTEIFDQVNDNYEKSILGFNVIFSK